MADTTQIDSFIRRMKRLGIDIQLWANYPWIYISSINNKRVKETFQADHGFTIAFLGTKVEFTDIKEIFKLIRKYI